MVPLLFASVEAWALPALQCRDRESFLMVSTRHIVLLAVFCIIPAACANRGVPSALSDRVWDGAVVGIRRELLDLKDLQVFSLGPFVKSVVGDDAFRAYHMQGDELRLNFALASIHGRFLACKARDGSSVCVIEASTRESSVVPCPEKGLRVTLGAWNRDENSLLCFCYRQTGELQKGHLYLLRHNGKEWSWQKLTGAGEVSGRKGSYEITKGAWADDSTILFSSDGQIMRFDIRTQVLEHGPEGHAAYALGKDTVMWKNEDGFVVPFLMARWNRNEKVAQTRAMRGNGVALNGWPVISPDGDLLLFTHWALSSHWGHAAISRRLCLYDVKADRFYRLLKGLEREAPVMDVVASGVWIRDDHGLRGAAVHALSRK